MLVTMHMAAIASRLRPRLPVASSQFFPRIAADHREDQRVVRHRSLRVQVHFQSLRGLQTAASMSPTSLKLAFVQLSPRPDPKYGYPCTRSSHGLSVVGGKIILYGGEHVARTPLDEEKQALWIVSDDQWRCCVIDANAQPPARVAHAQAVVGDDSVYIFGGRAGITMKEHPMNDLWKFNVDSETWTQVETFGTPPSPRSFHRMVACDGSLYVFGGCGAEGRMADLYQLNLETRMWKSLGNSPLLRGRGGPNLIVLNERLAVVGGFAGEETNDGHAYSTIDSKWDESPLDVTGMRPRSVCVSASLGGLAVIFGGEVDPSELGHEGAGGFENDVVVMDGTTGKYLETLRLDPCPEERGWSAGAATASSLYIFGGLAGDDANPKRLNDLWRLDLLE